MEGYLLDTNAVSHWHHQHPRLAQRINALAGHDQLRVSAITLGEIEFGHNLYLRSRDLVRRDEFANWVSRNFPKSRTLEVTRDTRDYYGVLRAAIFEKYPPLKADENHPELCYDPVSASELGIDENDLWIAAQAIEHGLTLVTQDNMDRIKQVAKDIRDWQLKHDDWTV